MDPFAKSWPRRDVFRAGALATAAFAVPLGLRGQSSFLRHSATRLMAYDAALADRDTMRALAMRAIDAARHAGATYAEARVTRTVMQEFSGAALSVDRESLGIGVRALVHGAWGFAASPYWTLEEAAILARGAVAQATVNAKASSHPVDLGSYPVATGSWSTPVRIDPFMLPIEEKIDFFRSFADDTAMFNNSRRKGSAYLSKMDLYRQERAVASTDGADFMQTIYQAGGQFFVTVQNTDWRRPQSAPAQAQLQGSGIGDAGAGWELFLDAGLHEQVPRLLEDAEASLAIPHKPVEVGRYDIVMSGASMAGLLVATLGAATELDRALGYEANAGGTSYLGPNPLTLLGKATLGTPLLNVTGDRSMPGGLATVKWDDEGVEPETFPLVTNGVLTDYQTTREQAAWLAPWYEAQHRPVRSHGCAGAMSALSYPLQFTPNLTLAPGLHEGGVDELVAATKRGLFFEGRVSTDFQSRSGVGLGTFREIVNGKLGAIVDGAAFMFDSSQIWKTLTALGGPSSRVQVSAAGSKGQPTQRFPYSVAAVPGILANAAVVDLKRPR
jgi:TldD protein